MTSNRKFLLNRLISSEGLIREALCIINKLSNYLTLFVLDSDNKLVGTVTDGDIRRKLLNVQKPFSAFFSDYVIDHSIQKPTVCYENDSLKSAVALMEEKQIWDLPVIDNKGNLVGLLHLHAAIKNFI